MKITIGCVEYRSKKAATEHFKRILNSTGIGTQLRGIHLRDVLHLLQRHPEYDQKAGAGIVAVRVARAPSFNTRCFYVIRADGTETDFSYRTCVSGKAPTLGQRFAEACRRAVAVDIVAFKRSAFGRNAHALSAISGKPVAWRDAHVDHAPPHTFRAIVESFGAPSDSWLTPPDDNQAVTTFCDDGVRERFRSHHNRLASLRIVSADENLRLPRV